MEWLEYEETKLVIGLRREVILFSEGKLTICNDGNEAENKKKKTWESIKND